jgi:DNA-binding MarR family transcriptional regulator
MNKPKRSDATGEAAAAGGPERTAEVRLGPLDDLIGFHLRLAQDASFRAFAGEAGQPDIKPGRFAAMMLISHNPGITQIALARAMARDKSTITPVVQELEKRGLVARRQMPSDRRSFTLELTPQGETTLQDLLAHALEHDRRLDAIVGEAKPEFLRLLRKIADGLG